MKLEKIVEIGRSAYQTSKKFVKNPKRLAVSIALGLALSYSSR